MKSKRKAWSLALIPLLLASGVAYAQVQPITARGMHSRDLLPSRPLRALPAQNSNGGAQPGEAPALSLTWGIYTFPGTVGSFTAGVNKAGHAVGGYGPYVNANTPSNHGFLLKGTKFTTIDYPGAVFTQPNAINDAGVIVGGWGTSLYSKDTHGFKLVGTTLTSIDYPGATDGTGALGINKHGDIVGGWFDASTEHGFLLSKGVFTTIDVPGAFYTVAWGINSAGDIVGWYGASFSESHGFIYSKGTFTALDYPGYSQNYVADINDSGLIAGGYGDAVTINGVLYQWEHSYIYKSGVFTTFDAPFGPPAATQIWHLNNDGVISGYYADTSSTVYGFEAVVGP